MRALDTVKAIVDKVHADKRLLLIVIIINLLGTLLGVYYYWLQLSITPFYLWLFVPDCPLYVFFMAIALTLIWLGKPWKTFNVLTAVGCAMYGVWTMATLLYFSEFYFNPSSALMSTLYFVSHFGMAVESVLLIPFIKDAKVISWATTLIWFLVLDLGDFFITFMYNDRIVRLNPLAILEVMSRVYGDTATMAKIDSLLYMTVGLTFMAMLFVYWLAVKWPSGNIDNKSEKKAPVKTTP